MLTFLAVYAKMPTVNRYQCGKKEIMGATADRYSAAEEWEVKLPTPDGEALLWVVRFVEEANLHHVAIWAEKRGRRCAGRSFQLLYGQHYSPDAPERAYELLFSGGANQRGGSSTGDFGFDIPALRPGVRSCKYYIQPNPYFYYNWPANFCWVMVGASVREPMVEELI